MQFYRKPQNRWHAFLAHLLISLIIFVILAAIIIFIWYPGFLFYADGGLEGLKLIAGVDLIIGPILTLMVYNTAKTELGRDLLIIAVIQLGCLTAGLWLVYHERTLAVVYADGSFHTMSSNSFIANGDNIDDTSILLQSAPVWVYVDLPVDKEGRSAARRKQLSDGILHTRTDLYVPYLKGLSAIRQEGQEHGASESQPTSSEIKRRYKLIARYKHGELIVDTATGAIASYTLEQPQLP